MNSVLILSAIAAGVSSFTLGPHKTFKPQPLTQRGFSMRSLPAEYDTIEALQKLDFRTLKRCVYPCEK